jgi:hypothetical protein
LDVHNIRPHEQVARDATSQTALGTMISIDLNDQTKSLAVKGAHQLGRARVICIGPRIDQSFALD